MIKRARRRAHFFYGEQGVWSLPASPPLDSCRVGGLIFLTTAMPNNDGSGGGYSQQLGERMNFQDLADDSPEKAWDAFLRAEKEYQSDPQNRDKFLKAREAFKTYDTVRVKINFPKDQQ